MPQSSDRVAADSEGCKAPTDRSGETDGIQRRMDLQDDPGGDEVIFEAQAICQLPAQEHAEALRLAYRRKDVGAVQISSSRGGTVDEDEATGPEFRLHFTEKALEFTVRGEIALHPAIIGPLAPGLPSRSENGFPSRSVPYCAIMSVM